MGAASAAGGAAPRGVGRREVLRDAGSDLAGSGAPHRSAWSCSICVWRFGFAGKYQVQRPRPRAAGDDPAGSLSHDPQPSRPRRRPSCRCAGAGSRIGAIRSSATCRGGSSAPRRWRSCAIAFTFYYARLGDRRPLPCTPGWRRSASKTSSPAATPRPVKGPTLKQLLAADEAARHADASKRAAAGRRSRCWRRPVRVRQRRRSTRSYDETLQQVASGAEPGARAVCWSSATPTTSRSSRSRYPRQLRAVARARGQRRRRPASGRSTTPRGVSWTRRRVVASPCRPGPIRRTARATGGSRSSTSAR